MNLTTILTLSCVCFLASNTALAAEKVYKWTDSKGQTHYTQRPPANTETEVIKPQTGHSDPVSYATAPEAKDKTETPPAENKAASTKDKERCDIARKNVDTLKTYGRIRIQGDDGQYRYLTQDEQQQKLTEANKAIEESCE